MNPAQLFLIELKMCGLQTLDYHDFVGFIGAIPCLRRNQLYLFLRPSLSDGARRYWDAYQEAIQGGIIHCGKFEKYFAHFRRFILPLVHSQEKVQEILSLGSLNEQRTFYDQVWNNRKWRWLFRIFFGRFLLGHLGRDSAYFTHVELPSIAGELLQRIRRGMVEVPINDNYFIEYILTGRFRDLDRAHPYLREANFYRLKKSLASVRLVEAPLRQFLNTLPPGSISKFNLSDIFEYMPSSAFESALREILRACRAEAGLVFWTLFVPRFVPPLVRDRFNANNALSKELFVRDRTFFYGNFHKWHCRPVPPISEPGSTTNKSRLCANEPMLERKGS
jgi:S-adenosylmethionine-diacylglycerol 3-amino-3-carboxypropyl transferase